MEMEPEASSRRDNKHMYLVWEDVNVVLRNDCAEKLLISDICGYVQAGRIMAIMGPSGCGKSTLLDALAGRPSGNVVMSGTVLLNGKKRSSGCRDVAYVTQEDVFLGTLTVRETLSYSAHLRLPAITSKEEIDHLVENVIAELGLDDCADNRVGNWLIRGLSNGEKRRLSVGLEMLTQPHVLFLDEPTSGLDGASAFFVIQSLRNIAREGRIVICSIHQPSSDVYGFFDDLLLLSGGETVYFGEAKQSVKFFADAGFPCPTRKNPPDHFLRCITSDFDKVFTTLKQSHRNYGVATVSDIPVDLPTSQIKATLIRKYKSSNYSTDARKRIQEIAHIKELDTESNLCKPGWCKQLCTMTRRSSLNMSRDIGYYWLRIVFYMLVSVSTGTFYLNVGTGTDSSTIMSRGKCYGFIYGLMICLSIGGLPFFIEELKVFRRERLSGHCGEAVYVISNLVSSAPFLVVISITSGTIIYYIVGFHPGIDRHVYFCINLFCCIAITEVCTQVVASLVPDLLMAIGTTAGLIVITMMASELFRRTTDLPKFFWRYPMSYISYAAWGIEGLYKNDMIGTEFDPILPGGPKIKGENIIGSMIGINPDVSKWWNIAALIFILLSYRLLFYILLKYRAKITALLCSVFAKRSIKLQPLTARRRSSSTSSSSFRVESLGFSKRHQPPQALSSLEYIGSPDIV